MSQIDATPSPSQNSLSSEFASKSPSTQSLIPSPLLFPPEGRPIPRPTRQKSRVPNDDSIERRPLWPCGPTFRRGLVSVMGGISSESCSTTRVGVGSMSKSAWSVVALLMWGSSCANFSRNGRGRPAMFIKKPVPREFQTSASVNRTRGSRLTGFNKTDHSSTWRVVCFDRLTILVAKSFTGSNIDQTPAYPTIMLFHQRQGVSDTPGCRSGIALGRYCCPCCR